MRNLHGKIARPQSWPRSMPIRRARRISFSPTPRTPTWRSASARPANRPRRTPAKSGCARWPNIASRFATIVRQGLVDIMLMSASTNDLLTIGERLFENSHVTPAGRANDTSDVFVVRGGHYLEPPARPFRTATLDHHPMRPRRLRAGRANPRRESRALQRHVQQPPRRRPANARRIPPLPQRGRGEGLSAFPGSVRPERAARSAAGAGARISSTTRSRARWPAWPSRPAGFLEDRLPRPAGDGRARRLRSASGRRHPRRRRGHDLRRVQAPWPRPRNTAPGRRSSAARSTTPNANWRSSNSCGRSSITKSRRKKRCERITACCKS